LERLAALALARPWVWVAGLTFLGLLLRRYHLGYESLWFDEADAFPCRNCSRASPRRERTALFIP
jgi:hypothetical protein